MGVVVAGHSRKRMLLGALALIMVSALALGAFAPFESDASSHREAPLISGDPQVDNTDVYAFVSPDSPETVTIISSFIPFEEPAGGPNFYTFASKGARYDINIDHDGDARADLIYRYKFKDHRRSGDTFLYATGEVTSLDDEDLNVFQTYDLVLVDKSKKKTKRSTLVNDSVAVPSNVGEGSMPDYESLRDEGIESFGALGKAFAGQSDDPFFLDLRVFDLLYGGDFSEVGDDTLKGFNVNTLALQVPKADLAKKHNEVDNPIVGVWSTSARRSATVRKASGNHRTKGRFVQVSRLAMPLVNEVVIPLRDKDRWNGSKPTSDGQFLEYVDDPEVPHLVEALYGIPAPDSDPDEPGIQRDDLISVFLTGVEGLNMPPGVTPSEMLRLNTSIPPCEQGTCPNYSRLGVIGGDNAGYPNGRRLADDTLDITLQVAEGELLNNPNDLSDGVDVNDVEFGSIFPYVALPHSGSNEDPH